MGKVIYMSANCQIEGCEAPVKARGLCNAHYMRLRKTGELASYGQPLKERGIKRDHPHYFRWCKLHGDGKLCERWDDFWTFVADVGDGNGCKKILRRDQTRPYGPDNFYWAEKLVGERKNAYYRERYKNTPRDRDLRFQKQYGITLAEYDAMSEAQGHCCAICAKPENKVVRRGVNEDIRRLAVDHDHRTGKVRGLLCADCNRAIGLFADDPSRIHRAIAFLEAEKRSRFRVVK
jgi:Recombination endonuclease VII